MYFVSMLCHLKLTFDIGIHLISLRNTHFAVVPVVGLLSRSMVDVCEVVLASCGSGFKA
jgi:hypothetical protein